MVEEIFKIYLSHHIRGPKGEEATPEDMRANCDKHHKIGEEIGAYLYDWWKILGFPKAELYVPADHDEFIQIAYRKNIITEAQILEVDCDIVSSCSLLIAFTDSELSKGMKIEVDHALNVGVPIYYMPDTSRSSIGGLNLAMRHILGDDIENNDIYED